MSYSQFLKSCCEQCECCPMCSSVPCDGVQAGGFCDSSTCICDEDEDYEEEFSE